MPVIKQTITVWTDSNGVNWSDEASALKAESEINHLKAIDELSDILNDAFVDYEYDTQKGAKELITNADVVIGLLLPYSIKHKEYADACGNRSESDS